MASRTYTFLAKDKGGNSQRLTEFTEQLDGTTAEGGGFSIQDDGVAEIRDASGRKVNRIAKGKYRVVGTGLELFSDDPNAP